MTLKEHAELMSLALTAPMILLAWLVVWNYAPRALRAAKEKQWKVRKFSDVELLIAGITVGFIGSGLDNLYWGFAWGSSFLGLTIPTEFLFTNGVYPNIPFRQVAGIIAALLHLWPILRTMEDKSTYLRLSVGVGFVSLILLIFEKGIIND